MNGREIYLRICDAGSIDAEVSRLSRDELAAVTEYLSDIDLTGGVPAMIWGAVRAAMVPLFRQRPKTAGRKTQEKNS